MDLKFNSDGIRFKARACGVVVNNNKVLMCNINDNGFWCCPGGHIHLGENSKAGVLREVEEEIGVKFDDAILLSITENFFGKKGVSFHEYSFFYRMIGEVPKEKTKDYSIVENDEWKMVHLDFKWIDISEIDKFDIRPNVLKKVLKDQTGFKHFILVDNVVVDK